MAAAVAGVLAVGLWLARADRPQPGDADPGVAASFEGQAGGALLALVGRSAELESLRAELDTASLPMRLDAMHTVTALEERIEQVDARLARADSLSMAHGLWQERVDLLEAVIALEAAENDYLYFADSSAL
jgi:hypothetical protein